MTADVLDGTENENGTKEKRKLTRRKKSALGGGLSLGEALLKLPGASDRSSTDARSLVSAGRKSVSEGVSSRSRRGRRSSYVSDSKSVGVDYSTKGNRERRRLSRSSHRKDNAPLRVLERVNSTNSASGFGINKGAEEGINEKGKRRARRKGSHQAKDVEQKPERANSAGSFGSVGSVGDALEQKTTDNERAKRRAKKKTNKTDALRVLGRAESVRTLKDLKSGPTLGRKKSLQLERKKSKSKIPTAEALIEKDGAQDDEAGDPKAIAEEAARKRKEAEEILRQAKLEEVEARNRAEMAERRKAGDTNEDSSMDGTDGNESMDGSEEIVGRDGGDAHSDSSSDIYLDEGGNDDDPDISETIIELSDTEKEDITGRSLDDENMEGSDSELSSVAEEIVKRVRDRKIQQLEQKYNVSSDDSSYDGRSRRREERLIRRNSAGNMNEGNDKGKDKAQKKAEREQEVAQKREELEAHRLEAQRRKEARREEKARRGQ